MNYHNITTSDMLNGDGLRTVLWVAGCEHHCYKCQNPQTWNPDGGIPFDEEARAELFRDLAEDYIGGVTFSGGDPLHPNNRDEVDKLIDDIRERFPDKTIWLYTGYMFDEIMSLPLVSKVDVLVDGEYFHPLRDVTLPWKGSANQRVIDVKRTLAEGRVVLWA